mmetsp:Transcript_143579/g.357831  ORF Transcript_143579/g.357831 Transcript_143579/m.357831 type:complete len:206 (+) Transcript_143579:360-977(+)
MYAKQARRRDSRPARSATIKRSATMSTVRREERAATQSSTRTETWYRCAASSSATVSPSLLRSDTPEPVYMNLTIRLTAAGSRSEIVTSFFSCSSIDVDHIASKTGDRAARTTLWALIRTSASPSPTTRSTSLKRPESSKVPKLEPRSAMGSGRSTLWLGRGVTRESETVILHSTVSVSSTSQPFAESRTLRRGMKPSACSLPMA